MKTVKILISINWMLSFCILGCVDTERSAIGAALTALAWFAVSSALLKYADRLWPETKKILFVVINTCNTCFFRFLPASVRENRGGKSQKSGNAHHVNALF
jgi:hypothetical protein